MDKIKFIYCTILILVIGLISFFAVDIKPVAYLLFPVAIIALLVAKRLDQYLDAKTKKKQDTNYW